ncbi:hypothetical protein ACH4U3_04125 [Streptomyces griseoruber]|uniref:hypothetical protein n=1 Tax=Streptomyces griseoruber TaxID=1943 RepID=UPI0037AA9453
MNAIPPLLDSYGALHCPEFDASNSEHVESIITLYRAYLLEEFERTKEWPDGVPIGEPLKTIMMEIEGETIGFASVDVVRYAVELAYIIPAYRRRGITRAVLKNWRDACPHTLQVKGPISPSARSLCDSLGIPETSQPEEEVAARERLHAEAYATVAAQCRHRHGHPGRPCQQCCRKHLSRTADVVVRMHVNTVTAGALHAL